MGPRDTSAEVLSVEEQPLPYYTLSLRAPSSLADASPGQFVMIQTDPLEPYLRRAFSVFDVSKEAPLQRIDLLGKIIGPGTQRLAALEPGRQVPVLGPLGRGFRLQGERPALVAGGVGSAALLLLARALAERGLTVDFYYGGRSAVDLVCADRFRRICDQSGGRWMSTTEDGSAGRRGLITEPLEEGLSEGRHDTVYTCGPMGLMRRVAQLAEAAGVSGQAALETPMGCGFGACIGCAVPHPSGRYALCCKDGPAFAFDEVDWDRAR